MVIDLKWIIAGHLIMLDTLHIINMRFAYNVKVQETGTKPRRRRLFKTVESPHNRFLQR